MSFSDVKSCRDGIVSNQEKIIFKEKRELLDSLVVYKVVDSLYCNSKQFLRILGRKKWKASLDISRWVLSIP